MRQLSNIMWERHRTPWSGWTRVPIGFLLAGALWFHHWPLLAAAILLAITNPLWFSPPDRSDAFMTRAVDGERLWLGRVTLVEEAIVLGPVVVLSLVLIWALYVNAGIWALIAGLTVLVHKILFLIDCAGLPAQARAE